LTVLEFTLRHAARTGEAQSVGDG
jgi:hypothetical protein